MATGTLDAANAETAVTGAWYVAPVGTAGPTSADSALAAEWQNLGYLSEDGTTRSMERSTEAKRAWQNRALLRTLITEAGVSYTFTLVETTRATVEFALGVTIEDDGTYDVDPGETGGIHALVFDVLDGEKITRRWMPRAEVTELAEQTFSGTELVSYEVTITVYASPELAGLPERTFAPHLAVAGGA